MSAPNPPQYDSALNAPSSDAPPSYESLNFIRQIQKAKEETSNPVEFLTKACCILCGSIVFTVFFALLMALPIAMIVIGATKNDCPVEKFIPIWLIVAGSVGAFSTLLRLISNCFNLCKKRNNDQQQNLKTGAKKNCLSGLIELFLFAWLIAGSYWVYHVRSYVSYDPLNVQAYCDQTCYLFAFWVITVSWIMMAVFCCCCCCILVIAGCGAGIASMCA